MIIQKVYRKDLQAWRWKIDLTVDNRRIRRADFPTQKEALEAIAALHLESRSMRYGLTLPRAKTTLKELYNRISQTPEIKSRQQILSVFEEFMGLLGQNFQLTDLAKADWKTFVDSCRQRDLKPATVNRYLAAISGILRKAPEYFPALSEWSPPKAPWEPAPLGRERILHKKEIQALLIGFRAEKQQRERDRGIFLRGEVLDLFRLMLLTAAREGELLNLKQSQISWDWQTVTIDSKKGGVSRRVIPLSKTALDILKARQIHSPRVFKPLPKNSLYYTLNRVGQISGVPYGEKIEYGWVIYDLRHLAATIMENSGTPYSAVSAILGHKRQDQTATYTHAQQSTMRKGIESLENWCREIDGFMVGHAEIERDSQSVLILTG